MDQHPAIAPGHVAVVTGAASGIGLAAARRFASAGMRVVVADIDGDGAERAAAAIREEGGTALAVAADVALRADVERMKMEADRAGPVTVLMNNAGREGGGALFAGEEVWQRTIGTNLWGAIHGIQVFVPGMIAGSRPAAIVNTGSKQGITLPPGDTAYNVSKAALKALTESLAHELLDTGGRVTAHLLIPGFTYTGFTRARGATEKPPGAWMPEQVVDALAEGMARGDFYILCPDNEATPEMDARRIRWAAEDIILNRPALSRWHPGYRDAFKAFMDGTDRAGKPETDPDTG